MSGVRSSLSNAGTGAASVMKVLSNAAAKTAGTQVRSTLTAYKEKQKDDATMNQASRQIRQSGSYDSLEKANEQGLEDTWNAEDRLARATRGANMGHIVKYAQYVSQKDIKKLGVEKNALIKVAVDEDWQSRFVVNFPLTVAYLIFFMLIFQEHYGVSFVYLQENQMRQSVIQPSSSVRVKEDIFRWMDTTLVPYLWSSSNVMPGGPHYSTEWATSNQELVGGFMIKTVRGPMEKCRDSLVQRYDCFDEFTSVTANDQVFNNGWSQQTRRLEEVYKEYMTPQGSDFISRFGMGSVLGKEIQARDRVRQKVFEARRNATANGVKRVSLAESKRVRKREQAAAQAEKRRLEVVNAHMMDSVPNVANFARLYQFFVPMSMTLQEVKDLLRDWQSEETPLITNTTIVLTISFLVRNPDFQRGMLTQGETSFIFSRGGTIYQETHFSTMLLTTSRLVTLGLIVWGFILLVFTLASSFKLHAAISHGDVCSYFMHFNNFWEWMLVVVGWTIMILVLAERFGVAKFNRQWEEYTNFRQSASQITIKEFDRSWLQKFEANVRSLALLDENGQLGVAFYHIFLVFRILMTSQGHPRLAIVVNTISQGFNDLVHLFIVFCIITISFVFMGHILFGTRMAPFSTIKGSLGYCMQIVLQREYDNDTIQEVDYFTSFLWIAAFVIIVVLVVVNIVLAMIFDNYGDVTNQITSRDTIWHTARRKWNHFRHYNSWVSNSNIIRALSKTSSSELITKQKLIQLIPQITNEQIDELYDTVKLRLVTSVVRTKKNIVPEALAAILISVEDLRSGVRMMSKYGALEDTKPKRSASKPKPSGPVSSGGEESDVQGEDGGETAPLSGTIGAETADDQMLDEDPNIAPKVCPFWVKDGLVKHLHKRQAAMDQLFLQIQQIHTEIRKRGLGTNCDEIPLEEPEQPSREGSKRLDPSLTGMNMKPMISPGQERSASMAAMPRRAIAPGSFGVAKRFGRS